MIRIRNCRSVCEKMSPSTVPPIRETVTYSRCYSSAMTHSKQVDATVDRAFTDFNGVKRDFRLGDCNATELCASLTGKSEHKYQRWHIRRCRNRRSLEQSHGRACMGHRKTPQGCLRGSYCPGQLRNHRQYGLGNRPYCASGQRWLR